MIKNYDIVNLNKRGKDMIISKRDIGIKYEGVNRLKTIATELSILNKKIKGLNLNEKNMLSEAQLNIMIVAKQLSERI